jgi:hypothetical protein
MLKFLRHDSPVVASYATMTHLLTVRYMLQFAKHNSPIGVNDSPANSQVYATAL